MSAVTRSRGLSGVFRLFVGDVLVLACVALAAEVLLRVAAPRTLHKPVAGVYELTDRMRGGFLYRAGSSTICNNGFGNHEFSINRWHARDREYGPREPGELRILSVGDSFSENQALNVEQIYPNVLEENLAGALTGRPVSVINAGMAGWGLRDYQDYIEWVLPEIQPDVVILAVGLAGDFVQDATPPPKREMALVAGLPVSAHASPSSRAVWGVWFVNEWLEAHSHAYALFRDASFLPMYWLSIGRYGGISPLCTDPDLADKVVEPTRHVLGELKGLCESHGATLVVLNVPRSYECIPHALDFKIQMEKLDVSALDVRRPATLLERIAEELQLPLYDPSDDLAGADGRVYFPRFDHWNVLGNQVIARGLERVLRAHGLLDRGADSQPTSRF